ncbi:hypothetical protein Vretimale_9578 [Volvox reticuliferus]|uniref:J domain-containing protein n=1 Tax=Volvox reticuliferus TaxID=1737510 RepID=A0A8J4LPW8_9CHLO|nr:hypothetical protein Vretifemale_18794 [Volvox reticuliferus]GIM05096.1 hypothetical protein Vretimale_9578 [Volvox reticuliferus]
MGREKGKKEKEKSKSKKAKKHKKHRRRSSSGSSDSDGHAEGAEQQLARERTAVSKLRDILSSYPAVRKELREMLWRVDQGEAANISGVPDSDLKASLAQLLELLRLRRSDKGIYGLLNRSAKILPIVGFVFDEPPRQQSHPVKAPMATLKQGEFATETDGGGSTFPGKPESAPDVGRSCHTSPVGPIGPVVPESAIPVTTVALDEDTGISARERSAGEASQQGTSVARVNEDGFQAEDAAASAAAAAGPVAPRRVAGPAMPPRELLEAAAAAAEALQAAGPPQNDNSDDGGLLVGPPPPELVEELEATPQDEREAEVVRIMKVLRDHNAAATGPKPQVQLTTGPDAHGATVDAYSVLGVSPSTSVGDVKKRYMRLSLLIHPDKCSHPLAHEAFQAVAASAKVLQDSEARSALDERRADAELRRRAEAAAEAQERERAWRVARGEEVPALAGPVGPSGPQRETWMTELPPEMVTRPGAAGLSQTSVRAFSQRGKTGRGDTSSWTDNPEQRKAREAQALLTAASQAYVQALSVAGDGGCAGASSSGTMAAAAMDSFNSGSRKKSLMEVHLELQEKAKEEARAAKKAAKKQKTSDGAANVNERGTGGVAEGNQDWPWRPFDRERDLEIKPRAKTGTDIFKNATTLGSKFSGGGTQRHFL